MVINPFQGFQNYSFSLLPSLKSPRDLRFNMMASYFTCGLKSQITGKSLLSSKWKTWQSVRSHHLCYFCYNMMPISEISVDLILPLLDHLAQHLAHHHPGLANTSLWLLLPYPSHYNYALVRFCGSVVKIWPVLLYMIGMRRDGTQAFSQEATFFNVSTSGLRTEHGTAAPFYTIFVSLSLLYGHALTVYNLSIH